MSEPTSRKSGLIVLFIAAIIGAVLGVSSYNGIVSKQEKVESASADISAQLQRRADLIPNLVSTVKGYAEHETAVIDSITSAREKLVNAGTVKEQAEAGDALTEALAGLTVIAENYPDLKADTNFVALQDELAGTENRIATARKDYNAAVSNYNAAIKKFPGKFLADRFGFEPAEYFEAKAGSEEVPDVSF